MLMKTPRSEPTLAGDGTRVARADGILSDLVLNGSIELSGRMEELHAAAGLLPYGMRVYVPSLPRRSVLDNLEALRGVKEAGFEPVPHVAARRLQSRRELERFLERAVGECGVTRVLLIGGDLDVPLGPYRDAAAVLHDGLLGDRGIREIGLAGYPEGHPRIPAGAVQAAFAEKLELAARAGLGAFAVTQFSFAPARIVEYCGRVARAHPDLPVYIGMPGPTDAARLMRYARICGVSASLRVLVGLGFQAARLVSRTAPDEQIGAIGRYCARHENPNVLGVHVFSFGGFAQSARWMMARGRRR